MIEAGSYWIHKKGGHVVKVIVPEAKATYVPNFTVTVFRTWDWTPITQYFTDTETFLKEYKEAEWDVTWGDFR